jgi:hypothetical protein
MSRSKLWRAAFAAALAATALTLPLTAGAHNAGHFVLPDGTCHEIGSLKDAPLIGPEGDKTQLDLIPETPNPPFDEYGASYAAFQGNTPILPGPCP